jgi:mono/diheme cytochrome c family protein
MKGQRRRPRVGMPFRNSSATRVGLGGWKSVLRSLLLFAVIVFALAGIGLYSIVGRGLSAHDEPGRIEALLATAMRRWATPREMRARPNPVPDSVQVRQEAMEHFADHCASCHANDGSGETTIARGMYPKPPDMRTARTQSLSDGELFWIIEHGIRLTGMPGWSTGTPDGERASWGLVRFIRHLPALAAEDVQRMETLNPRTAREWQQEEEARRFLEGEPDPPSGSAPQREQD